jgi:hypothetical protein
MLARALIHRSAPQTTDAILRLAASVPIGITPCDVEALVREADGVDRIRLPVLSASLRPLPHSQLSVALYQVTPLAKPLGIAQNALKS